MRCVIGLCCYCVLIIVVACCMSSCLGCGCLLVDGVVACCWCVRAGCRLLCVVKCCVSLIVVC